MQNAQQNQNDLVLDWDVVADESSMARIQGYRVSISTLNGGAWSAWERLITVRGTEQTSVVVNIGDLPSGESYEFEVGEVTSMEGYWVINEERLEPVVPGSCDTRFGIDGRCNMAGVETPDSLLGHLNLVRGSRGYYFGQRVLMSECERKCQDLAWCSTFSWGQEDISSYGWCYVYAMCEGVGVRSDVDRGYTSYQCAPSQGYELEVYPSAFPESIGECAKQRIGQCEINEAGRYFEQRMSVHSCQERCAQSPSCEYFSIDDAEEGWCYIWESCGQNAESAESFIIYQCSYNPNPTRRPTPEVGAFIRRTAWEIIRTTEGNMSLDRFANLITSARQETGLADPGARLTVFAPVNMAFERLSDAFSAQVNEDTSTAVQVHVVNGRHSEEQLMGGMELYSQAGDRLVTNTRPDPFGGPATLYVQGPVGDEVRVLVSIEGQNGTVYLLDGVIGFEPRGTAIGPPPTPRPSEAVTYAQIEQPISASIDNQPLNFAVVTSGQLQSFRFESRYWSQEDGWSDYQPVSDLVSLEDIQSDPSLLELNPDDYESGVQYGFRIYAVSVHGLETMTMPQTWVKAEGAEVGCCINSTPGGSTYRIGTALTCTAINTYMLQQRWFAESCEVLEARGQTAELQSCQTEEGSECYFPFVYAGQQYDACTTADSSRAWCSLAAMYSSSAWGYCRDHCEVDGEATEAPPAFTAQPEEAEDAGATTQPPADGDASSGAGCLTDGGRECALPFTYNGVTYNSCTNADSTEYWCSLDSQYQGRWGNCSAACSQPTAATDGADGADAEAADVAPPADDPQSGTAAPEETPIDYSQIHCEFSHNGRCVQHSGPLSSCTAVDGGSGFYVPNTVTLMDCMAACDNEDWCNYISFGGSGHDENNGWCYVYEVCDEGNRKLDSWSTTHYAAYSCTDEGNRRLPSPIKPEECPGKEVCRAEDGKACHFPFRYRGSVFNGCTDEHSSVGQRWCSYDENYRGKWGYCQDWCEDHDPDAVMELDDNGGLGQNVCQDQNGTVCTFPFTYQGTRQNECIPYRHKSWCSHGAEYDAEAWGYCQQGCPGVDPVLWEVSTSEYGSIYNGYQHMKCVADGNDTGTEVAGLSECWESCDADVNCGCIQFQHPQFDRDEPVASGRCWHAETCEVRSCRLGDVAIGFDTYVVVRRGGRQCALAHPGRCMLHNSPMQADTNMHGGRGYYHRDPLSYDECQDRCNQTPWCNYFGYGGKAHSDDVGWCYFYPNCDERHTDRYSMENYNTYDCTGEEGEAASRININPRAQDGEDGDSTTDTEDETHVTATPTTDLVAGPTMAPTCPNSFDCEVHLENHRCREHGGSMQDQTNVDRGRGYYMHYRVESAEACFEACARSGTDHYTGERWCNYVAVGSGDDVHGYWCYLYSGCSEPVGGNAGQAYTTYRCSDAMRAGQCDPRPGDCPPVFVDCPELDYSECHDDHMCSGPSEKCCQDPTSCRMMCTADVGSLVIECGHQTSCVDCLDRGYCGWKIAPPPDGGCVPLTQCEGNGGNGEMCLDGRFRDQCQPDCEIFPARSPGRCMHSETSFVGGESEIATDRGKGMVLQSRVTRKECFQACYDSGYDAWSGMRWCNFVAIGSGDEASGYWCYVYQNCDEPSNEGGGDHAYNVYMCPLRSWDPLNEGVIPDTRRLLASPEGAVLRDPPP